jgi:hypothetical protein
MLTISGLPYAPDGPESNVACEKSCTSAMFPTPSVPIPVSPTMLTLPQDQKADRAKSP